MDHCANARVESCFSRSNKCNPVDFSWFMSFQGFFHLIDYFFGWKKILAFVGQWSGTAKLAVHAIPIASF
jgi:hypothetical protein